MSVTETEIHPLLSSAPDLSPSPTFQRQSLMRRTFTKGELLLARRFAVAYKRHLKAVERGFDWRRYDIQMDQYRDDTAFEPEHPTDVALERTGKELGLRGKVDHGAYRTAYLTSTLVFKVQRALGAESSLTGEFRYIQKMKKSTLLNRHFPLTCMVGRTLMMQERVRKIASQTLRHLNDDVGELAEFLGIDDAHRDNFGWAGPKGKEWPVFIDIDFRIGSTRGRKKRIRSWMVTKEMKVLRASRAA